MRARRGYRRSGARTLALAQRAYIVNNGHIAHEAPASEIKAQPKVLERYLGV